MPADRVSNPPKKPLVIFDGDCGFCRYWILRWQRLTGDAADYLPQQEPRIGKEFPELDPSALQESVHFITTDGTVYRGAEAVFRLYASAGRNLPLGLHQKLPGAKAVCEFGYRNVATHRILVSQITRFFVGRIDHIPEFNRTASWFLRVLALVYLFAFGSLWLQMDALYGSNGILPVQTFLQHVDGLMEARDVGWDRYRLVPSLFWLAHSDVALKLSALFGVGLSLLLFRPRCPSGPVLAGLWFLYLSFVSVGQAFLSFQWDTLLLEVGLVAAFLYPWRIRLQPGQRQPSVLVLWGLRLILAKLMLASGWVKLLSQDPRWHDLSALSVHYETQPLPTVLGWFAHQLPDLIHRVACGAMFAIELIVPFLVIAPRRWRLWAFFPLIGLQILIALTGNYGFFNLLTAALCILLLDDTALPHWRLPWFRKKEPSEQPAPSSIPVGIGPHARRQVLVALLVLLTLNHGANLFRQSYFLLKPVAQLQQLLTPLRSSNTYGLFAVMTYPRREITIQGSRDGTTWLDYRLRYQPGPVNRWPRFVAPHQPRVDWQMWFAALGTYQQNSWFVQLCIRLLEGHPDIQNLFAQDPFPNEPPQFVRALSHKYEFTDQTGRSRTGNWWQRSEETVYLPPISLRTVRAAPEP